MSSFPCGAAGCARLARTVGGCHQHRDTLLAGQQAARIDILEAALGRIQALEEAFQDLELALAATQEGSTEILRALDTLGVREHGADNDLARKPERRARVLPVVPSAIDRKR